MKISRSVIAVATLLGALLSQPLFADGNARAFTKLDVDGDGFINETEALEHVELSEAFAESDENEDGRLDLSEFMKLEFLED